VFGPDRRHESPPTTGQLERIPRLRGNLEQVDTTGFHPPPGVEVVKRDRSDPGKTQTVRKELWSWPPRGKENFISCSPDHCGRTNQ